MATKEKKSRGWLTVVYPTEAYVRKFYPDCLYDGSDGWGQCDESFIDILAEAGMQALISPLHAFDRNESGEVEHKKPHWHVVLLWDGPTTYSNASSFVSQIKGVGCKAMQSLRGAARYLCHLDNPEKFAYPPDQVKQLGGLDYQEIIQSASDDIAAAYEIMDYCDEYQVYSFRKLMQYARRNRPDWARVMMTTQRENIFRYQRSLQNDLEEERRAADLALRPKVPEDIRHALEVENAKRLLEKEGFNID